MKKLIFTLILVIVLISLTVVGCKNDNSEKVSNDENNNGELVSNEEPENLAEEIPSYKTQLISYLSALFNEAYLPYYDGLRYEISHYEETTADNDYTATFFWTMYHLENGLDIESDFGKEIEGNFSFQATTKIIDGFIDLDIIKILADTSATGLPNYEIPVADFFPNQELESNILSNIFKQEIITFPANDKDKTQFNASIYEIEPFNLSLEVPTGWTLQERKSPSEIGDKVWLSGVWSILDILNEDGEFIGAIGYNIYELYEGAEDNPQAIYNQIALGNNYHFDVRESYEIVNETDSGKTALANVYYSANINNGTEKINKGIISYNKDFLVYIAIELADELVSKDEYITIAESIKFSE